MCGIVGYIGKRQASSLVVEGLRRLEYRGYDSAGIAVLGNKGRIDARKAVGRLSGLERRLEENPLQGTLAIGHTRWATHGAPNEVNCHPHASPDGSVFVVHNGIIENYQELRSQCSSAPFLSETDTEVIPHLIQQELQKEAAPLEAIRAALGQARGAYALGIMISDQPDTLYAARLGSPLIVGLGEEGTFIASDVPAILKEARRVIYLEDGEIAAISPEGVRVVGMDGVEKEVEIVETDLEEEAADRAGFETYMLKEIHEQPRVLRNLLEKNLSGDHILIKELAGEEAYFSALKKVQIVSCGSAYYAGCYGQIILEHFTPLMVNIELGSEFRYRAPKITGEELVIAVSQSGETADTLASVRMAKEKGCKILAICNVPGSSLIRESDFFMMTEAGPEIGVASTKAFTAQLLAFALLAHQVAHFQDHEIERTKEHIRILRKIPNAIHHVISHPEPIRTIAEKHYSGPSALYLGRRFNYPTAQEGALKNKEISYQHAEAYAAGEMKHGPIALISEYMPVVCICTRTEDEVYEKMISNMKEVEARNGRIIAVANIGDESIKTMAEDIMYVPETLECYSPLINTVALQLMAYYAAQARGTDIDKPRNLAKSVTVE